MYLVAYAKGDSNFGICGIYLKVWSNKSYCGALNSVVQGSFNSVLSTWEKFLIATIKIQDTAEGLVVFYKDFQLLIKIQKSDHSIEMKPLVSIGTSNFARCIFVRVLIYKVQFKNFA